MRRIRKSFLGARALVDGNLEVSRGDIHALCGRNGAGKSTLLNILMGFLRPDEGAILIEGRPVRFADARQAFDAGIAIVQQELSAVPNLTVAENIFLGAEPCRRGFVDFRQLNRNAEELLASLGFDIDPKATMSRLSVALQQLVEIAKALSHRNADILVFDEPTSAIGAKDTFRLFQVFRSLAAGGKGIIFVTHRIDEIFAVANTYTVLRDGARVAAGKIREITREQLIESMIGTEIGSGAVKRDSRPGNPLLEVRNLTRAPHFAEIEFTLHQGEVLGIFGLTGAGRTEVLETIYGLARADAGAITMEGRLLRSGDVTGAMEAGIAYVSEDRKRAGLVPSATVGENLSLAILRRLQKWGLIQARRERAAIGWAMETLRIDPPDPGQLVGRLSGGNQQKVVLGRCLLTEPKVLLLDEPTRGVDVGAKREIYSLISNFTKSNGGVVMVSSEIEEMMEVCDRILILRRGRLVETLSGAALTPNRLMMVAG